MKYSLKHYRLVSLTLLGLSFGLVLYIANELDLLGYTEGSASDQPVAEKQDITDQEVQLKRRERVLNEKEGILKDQLTRYEKLIVDLRTKLEKKEKEYQATLADKERNYKTEIASLEKQNKELKAQQEKTAQQRSETYHLIYEKMDSKKAAKILDEMEVSTATSILENVKQEKAADILSKMSSERARLITERANTKRRPASTKVSNPGDSNVNPAIENIPKGGE